MLSSLSILAALAVLLIAATSAQFNHTLTEPEVFRSKRCAQSTLRSGRINEKKIRKKMLDCMNKYRRAHQAAPLKLSGELNKIAHRWAMKLAKEKTLRHQKTRGAFGENLYSYFHSAGKLNKAEAACDAWYGELPLYDFKNGRMGKAGHFTQLVWRDSRRVGIGVVAHRGRYVVVADYKPAGNVLSKFKQNVKPKRRSLA